MRYLAADPGSGAAIARWVASRSGTSALAAAALAAAIAHTGMRAPTTGLVVMTAVLAAAQTIGTAGQALLAGTQAFRALAAISGVSAAVQVGGVAIGAITRGSTGAVVGYAAAQAVLAAAVLLRPGGAKPIAPDLQRRMRAYALHSWLATVVSLFTWSRLELVFLEQSSGAGAVAMYSVALTLAQMATQPTLLLGGALLPHFAALQAEGRDRLESTFGTVTRIFSALTLPLCFGLAALSGVIIELLFGAAFAGAVIPATIILAFAPFGAIGTVASSVLYGLERVSFISRSGVVAAIAAVAAYAVAIPAWGVTGAGAARSFVQAAATVAGFVYIGRVARLRVPTRRILRTVAAAVLASSAGGAVPLVAGRSWCTLLVGICVVIATYVPLGRALRIMESVDFEHVQNWLDGAPPPLGRQLRRAVAFLAHAPAASAHSSAREHRREPSP
jgi:O-antigen/teichoic acid export membrane protein